MMEAVDKIEVGDTWHKGSLGVVIFGYTDDSCGFVIFRVGMKGVGWLGDYQMETEHAFRRDFVFSYADRSRKESRTKNIKCKYNQLIYSLALK